MRILFLILSLSLISCRQRPSQGAAQSGIWILDDSTYFSVRFPPDYVASTFNLGKDSDIFPGLELSPRAGPKQSEVGTLFVAHDSTRISMLLRDGAELRIRDLKERGGNLLVPLHTVPTRNGNCLGFVISDPSGTCLPGDQKQSCFPIAYVAYCETPNSKRFSVMGMLASQFNNTHLEPAAVEMAKTFDKILATLEFKKV